MRQFFLFFWGVSMLMKAWGQDSINSVRFQITYQGSDQRYTVWVVPNYSTPNPNNQGTTEKGATAQVTLAVPKDFLIRDIQDIKGQWDKNPFKLGPGQPNQDWAGTGLDMSTAYYVIGKNPLETDYGSFVRSTPVALFSFRGDQCQGRLRVLDSNDPFIALANDRYSLNVANSFYSRSGQSVMGNQRPVEQFVGVFGAGAVCEEKLETQRLSLALPANQVSIFSVVPAVQLNGLPIHADQVQVKILNQPTSGEVRVMSTGELEFNPLSGQSGTFTFQYQVCLQNSPSVCTTGEVQIQVGAGIVNQTDLEVKSSASKKKSSVNDLIEYQIVVKNKGNSSVPFVQVNTEISSNQFVESYQLNQGAYKESIWSLPLMAPGDSAVLSLSSRIIEEGQYHLNAYLNPTVLPDLNSENNESSTCGSTPIVVCQGETVELSINPKYTGVRWYLNDILIGNQNLLTTNQSGVYTVIAENGDCLADGTCPIEIVHEICCPVQITIPSRTIKRKIQ